MESRGPNPELSVPQMIFCRIYWLTSVSFSYQPVSSLSQVPTKIERKEAGQAGAE